MLKIYPKLFTLMYKELIAIWQDKKTRFFLIGPPIIQFCIFTFAATLDVKNVDVAILNHDSGKHSYELIHRMKGSGLFRSIHELSSDAEAFEAVDRQEALVVMQIDDTFSKKLWRGETADIQILLDGRRSNAAQIVLGYISEIAVRYSQELRDPLSSLTATGQINTRFWYNPNLIYPWFTLTGLVGVISMMTSMSVSSLSIAREREEGTFDQLLVTPLSSFEIILGKAVPALLVGMFEGLLMLTLGYLFLGIIVKGSLILLVCALISFISAIVGAGLFVSSLAQTQQQATLGIFLMMAPAVILSGFATPVENMPHWLQIIAMVNPLNYFMIILRGLCLKDMPPTIVVQNILPMLMIATATVSLATWLFRRKTA